MYEEKTKFRQSKYITTPVSIPSTVLLRDKDVYEEKTKFRQSKHITTPVSTNNENIRNRTEYVVCNGLTNQLLGHASFIASAIESGQDILIPDAFIFNGVQKEQEKNSSVLRNVLTTRENSLPLSQVIDINSLLNKIKSYGINADVENYESVLQRHEERKPSCNWLSALQASNHETTKEILHSMKPSTIMSDLIVTNMARLKSSIPHSEDDAISKGICLHHRDGSDWHDHCIQWEGIKDGIWRKNCLNESNLPLHELVRLRIPSKYSKTWIYYIGDNEPDEKMISEFSNADIKIFHRKKDGLLKDEDLSRALGLGEITVDTHRDLFAAIDFFTCSKIDDFIGNSVSSFSATQIALRGGMNSAWYNSRSIPMADIFHAFNVPIVYTYTEQSSMNGQLLLKASVLSVRGTFGMSTDIHILYHGSKDDAFRKWLIGQKVILHQHEPKWLDVIETMRQHGDASASHLFLNKGNYIGTWQRIDIPLFINAEYCLLLDSDTIVSSAFGIHDFGLDITRSLAVSQEIDETNAKPWNLGVALMNVPTLRKTYHDFLNYISSHSHNPIFDGNPSDQGAYLTYYKRTVQFLDWTFNVKPYWTRQSSFDERKIVHFHGMKPIDIFKLWIGYSPKSFGSAMDGLVLHQFSLSNPRNQYSVMQDFSRFISSSDELLKEFCVYNFKGDSQKRVEICKQFFSELASGKLKFDKNELGSEWRYVNSSLVSLHVEN